jgi:hypothetical protein
MFDHRMYVSKDCRGSLIDASNVSLQCLGYVNQQAGATAVQQLSGRADNHEAQMKDQRG